MQIRSKHVVSLAASLAVLAIGASAKAALVLTLTEVSGPHAGATASYYPASGDSPVVDTTPFASGDFAANIDIGSSNLTTGSSEASLQIQYLDITSNVAGPVQLAISLTDSGFTFPGSVGSYLNLSSSAGATLVNYSTGDALTFQSSATDGGNTYATPTQTLVAPAGATSSSLALQTPDVSTTFQRSSPSYSLSDTATLDFSKPYEQENFNGTTVTTLSTLSGVPEPTSVLLAMPAAALLLRRKRTALTR